MSAGAEVQEIAGPPPPRGGKTYTSSLGSRICRPRYLPVLRSMWCGRRRSPLSLSSTYVGAFSASADLRKPRFMGDVFLRGTAITCLLRSARADTGRSHKFLSLVRAIPAAEHLG